MQLIYSKMFTFVVPYIRDATRVMIGQNYKSATWAKNEKKNKKMSLTVIKVPSPYPSVPSTYPPRTLPVPSPRQGTEMRQRDVTYLQENM